MGSITTGNPALLCAGRRVADWGELSVALVVLVMIDVGYPSCCRTCLRALAECQRPAKHATTVETCKHITAISLCLVPASVVRTKYIP